MQQGQPHVDIDRPFHLDASNSMLTLRRLAESKASRALSGQLALVCPR